MAKLKKEMNIIINGVGGQGLITLQKVLALAAIKSERDVKTSELHGLSQRGGSVEAHVRYGKKTYSPLVPKGQATMIFSLETQEALVASYYASKKGQTIFFINQYRTPTFTETIPDEKILSELKKISSNIFLIPASDICQKELGNPVVAGIFLLGFAFFGNHEKAVPLKRTLDPYETTLEVSSLEGALREVVPEKYLELNLKAFNLGKDYKI